MCKECGRQIVKDRVKLEITEERMSRRTSVRESPISRGYVGWWIYQKVGYSVTLMKKTHQPRES